MLKPVNIVQAAEADLKRKVRNAAQARQRFEYAGEPYEAYAFHRTHVRRADSAQALLVLALMNPQPAAKSAKKNTKIIYGNAELLVAAVRLSNGNI